MVGVNITELGESAAKNTFWLSMGLTLSTAISAVAMILMARLLGPAGYGIYSAATAPIYVISLFRDWGVNTAVTRYTAHHRFDASKKATYLKAAITFELASGGLISLIVITFSKQIAVYVLKKPEIAFLITIASIIVLPSGLRAVANGFLLGIERADIISELLVAFSIFRNSLALTLIILGWGPFGALIGQVVGFALNGIVAFTIAILIAKPRGRVLEPLKELLSYGLPYAVVLIMTGLSMQLYNLVAARILDYNEYGAFVAALNVFSTILAILNTITAGFLPSFSRISKEEIAQVFEKAVKYIAFLIAPLIAILIATAQPLMIIVFGKEYHKAGTYFMLMAVTYITSIFGIQIINSTLLGLAETKQITKIWIPALGMGILTLTLTTENLEAYSLILAIIITYLMATGIGLLIVKKYRATISIRPLLKILVTVLMAVFGGTLSHISLNLYINLVFSLTITTIIYTAMLVILKPLNFKELEELKIYVKNVPIIGGYFHKILDIYLKLVFHTKFTNSKSGNRIKI